MYTAGLVAVVAVNGKIAREINNGGSRAVYLPFGSEYSIRFKNNDVRRAAVRVTVDGKDVLNNRQLVIDGNSESEIKGFLDDSGNVAKNAFRFIEKTEKISNHRGDRIDDGIIRIEFQYENQLPTYPVRPLVTFDDHYKTKPTWVRPDNWTLNNLRSVKTKGIKSQNFQSSTVVEESNVKRGHTVSQNEAGITVAGSHVNQNFGSTTLWSLNPTKHVIVFELKGETTQGNAVVTPILTRKKVECPTCGKACKSSAKYCSECSTCLV